MTTDEAIDAYLAAFALHGFGGATVAAVAAHAGTDAAALTRAVAGRWEAVDAFNRRLDLLALAAASAEGTTRDRLFDLAMARFDAARTHREACAALAREARARPGLALALALQLGRTANLFLSAADARTTGARGIARVNAFAAIMAEAGQVWLRDDDPDLGATMRKLDRRLGQAEQLAQGRLWPRADDPAPEDAAGAI